MYMMNLMPVIHYQGYLFKDPAFHFCLDNLGLDVAEFTELNRVINKG